MVRRVLPEGLELLVLGLAIPICSAASACSSGDDTQLGPVADASAQEAMTAQDATAETIGDVINEPVELDAAQDSFDAAADSADTGQDAAAMTQRIASLNLHCLKTEDSDFTTNEQRFQAIAQTIAAEGIVAVAVQEACVAGTTDALEMLRAAISASTGETWSKQWMLAHVGWQGTPDEAQEGVGILARGSLTNVTQVEFRHQSSLRRVMIGATLPDSGLRLWSVHLEVGNPAMALLQAREAAAIAVAEADPSWDVIVGGDFNSAQGSPPLAAFETMGFTELTASLGANQIDHIFAHRGAAVSLAQTRILFDGTAQPKVSDHPGVMVELSPAAGQAVTRTRFLAHADSVPGNWLALRGSSPPLDWGWGWPAWKRADGSWAWVTSELQQGASLEYKWLADDTTWQTGGNASCAAGSDCDLSPAF